MEKQDESYDAFLTLPTDNDSFYDKEDDFSFYYEMNLSEIESLKEDRLITWYNKEIEALNIDALANKVISNNYGKSILDIYNMIEQEAKNHKSKYWFPNHYVTLHYKNIESKTKKICSCDFCACKIYPGKAKIRYRPLIIDNDTNRKYVLNYTIYVCRECERYLPENIYELEELANKLLTLSSFDTIGTTDIYYDHLMQKKGGEFYPKELKRKVKKNETRISK